MLGQSYVISGSSSVHGSIVLVRLHDPQSFVERTRERIVNEWIEVASAPFCEQRESLPERKRLAVNTIARECIEDVGDCRYPTLQRDLLSTKSAWVARSIEPLVVGKGDDGSNLQHFCLRFGEDAVADLGVG